jgi:hypothetical protein
MVHTIELITINTPHLVPWPNFQLCNMPCTQQTSNVTPSTDFNTLQVQWFVPSSSSLSILPIWYHSLTFNSATCPTLNKLPMLLLPRTSTLFEFDGLYHRAHPSRYSLSGTTAELSILQHAPHLTKFQHYSLNGLIVVWMRKHPPSILDP